MENDYGLLGKCGEDRGRRRSPHINPRLQPYIYMYMIPSPGPPSLRMHRHYLGPSDSYLYRRWELTSKASPTGAVTSLPKSGDLSFLIIILSLCLVATSPGIAESAKDKDLIRLLATHKAFVALEPMEFECLNNCLREPSDHTLYSYSSNPYSTHKAHSSWSRKYSHK